MRVWNPVFLAVAGDAGVRMICGCRSLWFPVLKGLNPMGVVFGLIGMKELCLLGSNEHRWSSIRLCCAWWIREKNWSWSEPWSSETELKDVDLLVDSDSDRGRDWNFLGGVGEPSWIWGAKQRWSSIRKPCCSLEMMLKSWSDSWPVISDVVAGSVARWSFIRRFWVLAISVKNWSACWSDCMLSIWLVECDKGLIEQRWSSIRPRWASLTRQKSLSCSPWKHS